MASTEEQKPTESLSNSVPYESMNATPTVSPNSTPYQTPVGLHDSIPNDKHFQKPMGMPDGAPLQPTKTVGSISLTPEMFEAMYLGPKTRVHGELRQTLGNPSPVGLAGFLMGFTPLIIAYMEWRGAGGQGVATIGTFYFLGGMLAILASIGEWVLGNSFPCTYFGIYGAWFLYYGATLTPFFNAEMASGGPNSTEFLASNGFVGIFMGLFTIYNAICALRVNVLFVTAFCLLAPSFLIFAAGQFFGAEGNAARAEEYGRIAGYVAFPVAMIAWYLLLEMMLSTVDFPIALPVGDLSHVVPSRTQLRKRREDRKGAAMTSPV